MSTTKKRLYEVRTNTNFHVNYEDNELIAQVELIFLTTEVKYEVIKKGGKHLIQKGHALDEFRMHTNLEGINEIIGQLQATATGLAKYDQLGAGLNAIIRQAKTSDLPDPVQPKKP